MKRNGFNIPDNKQMHITKFIIYHGISANLTIIDTLDGFSSPLNTVIIENTALMMQIGNTNAVNTKKDINNGPLALSKKSASDGILNSIRNI